MCGVKGKWGSRGNGGRESFRAEVNRRNNYDYYNGRGYCSREAVGKVGRCRDLFWEAKTYLNKGVGPLYSEPFIHFWEAEKRGTYSEQMTQQQLPADQGK